MFFFGFAVASGYLLPLLTPRIHELIEAEDALFTFCLVVSFSFAVVAERFGLHPMIGAYIAGLLVKSLSMRGIDTDKVVGLFTPIAMGFLGPLFFVHIALEVDIQTLLLNAPFALAIVLVSCFGKVAGCGLASRLSGSSWRGALVVGLGMNGRGAIDLVIAEFGRTLPSNPLPDAIYGALVLNAFINTLITPGVLKRAIPWYRAEQIAYRDPQWYNAKNGRDVGRYGDVSGPLMEATRENGE